MLFCFPIGGRGNQWTNTVNFIIQDIASLVPDPPHMPRPNRSRNQTKI